MITRCIAWVSGKWHNINHEQRCKHRSLPGMAYCTQHIIIMARKRLIQSVKGKP